MSAIIKIMVITLCMNLALAMAGISLGGFDAIGQFLNVQNDSVTPSSQFSLGGNSSTVPTSLQGAQGSLSASATGFSFIDSLKLVFGFFVLILVTFFFPIYWGFALGFPMWLTMLLFIQTFVGIMAVILAIRGVGS